MNLGTNFLKKTEELQKKRQFQEKVDDLTAYYTADHSKIQVLEKDLNDDSGQIGYWEWDYVFVLPNPDAQENDRYISSEDAIELFKEVFKPEEHKSNHDTKMQRKCEVTAFTAALRSIPTVERDNKRMLRLNKGGRYIKKRGEHYTEWQDTGNVCADLFGLIFAVLLHKLSRVLNYDTRSVLSRDGKHIFLLVHADENDLKASAEDQEYNMQMAIGISDLGSLEPCDEFYRPMSKIVPPQAYKPSVEELENSLAEYFQYSQELFGIDDEDPDEGDDSGVPEDEDIFENPAITPNEWELYILYLKNLLKLFNEGKETFHDRELHMKAVFLKKITKKAFDQANEYAATNYGSTFSFLCCCAGNRRKRLMNLWERLQFGKVLGAFTDFVRKETEGGEDEYDKFWRRYQKDESGARSIFRNMDRLKLINNEINYQVVVKKLVDSSSCVAYFPLHNEFEKDGTRRFDVKKQKDKVELSEEDMEMMKLDNSLGDEYSSKPLSSKWNTGVLLSWRKVPVHKIRNYFGEKIAFYYAFLSLYTGYLIPTGILGIAVIVVQNQFDEGADSNKVLNTTFCLLTILWSTLFYENWKRRQNQLAIEWGQVDFEQDEVVRPTFRGRMRRSPVDDSLHELWFSERTRNTRMSIGFVISFALLVLVVFVVFQIFRLRKYLTDEWEGTTKVKYATTITSVINAVQIAVFNILYQYLAHFLTNWENHRTQSAFESSLIAKTFLFQFVNSFNSLFYIAFFKSNQEGCYDPHDKENPTTTEGASCRAELSNTLMTIFLVAWAKNLVEVGLPFLKQYLKNRQRRLVDNEMSRYGVRQDSNEAELLRGKIEKEYDMLSTEAQDVDGTYADYMEMMIQYGYVVLFAVAFPISPLLAFFNNVFEFVVDKTKLMKYSRRPIPNGAEDIGIWNYILSLTATFAIFTNVAILCFTYDTFGENDGNRYAAFLAFAIGFLVFRAALSGWIPDVADGSITVAKRHAYIVDKHLKGFVKPQPRDTIPEKTDFSVKLMKALYRRLQLQDLVQEHLAQKSNYEVESEIGAGGLNQVPTAPPLKLPKGVNEPGQGSE